MRLPWYLMSAIFTKSSDWSYEREWRCLIARNAGESYDERVPFGENKGIALNTSPAKAIYLGCDIDENSFKRVISLCQDELNIPVYKMELSQSAYSLIPKSSCILIGESRSSLYALS